jgi:hypothetical protein
VKTIFGIRIPSLSSEHPTRPMRNAEASNEPRLELAQIPEIPVNDFVDTDVLCRPSEEPRMRTKFRDPEGNIQTATHYSTFCVRLGDAKRDLRKALIWKAWADAYAVMGCQLLEVEMIQTHAQSLY